MSDFPFRVLSENENTLLIAIWELQYKNKENSITKDKIIKQTGNENFKFSDVLHDLQGVSKKHFKSGYTKTNERYVISESSGRGKPNIYRLADSWLITTSKMAKYCAALVREAKELRVSKPKAISIGTLIFGDAEKAEFSLRFLLKAGYLQDEVTDVKIEERSLSFERKYLNLLESQQDV